MRGLAATPEAEGQDAEQGRDQRRADGGPVTAETVVARAVEEQAEVDGRTGMRRPGARAAPFVDDLRLPGVIALDQRDLRVRERAAGGLARDRRSFTREGSARGAHLDAQE